MVIRKIVSSPATSWTKDEGPLHHIVISSRIRLARNLEKLPMPPFQSEAAGRTVMEQIQTAVEQINEQEKESLSFYRLNELSPMDRQILMEKHLISAEQTDENPNKGLVINEEESISIMINEEDHLRIQVLLPGLQLEEAWEHAERVDDLFERKLEYAFHSEKGYLTSCPTNVGTGLRASVMVHLPALVMTNQANRVFSTLNQLGLAVRGLYGEGTEATGHLFQISNQITLGYQETEIMQNLITVTRQITESEEETRKVLLKEAPRQIADRVGRAYGILRYAAILSSQEALKYLSDIRLGIDLGLLDIKTEDFPLNELMVMTQPGNLQRRTGKVLGAIERDAARAGLFKEILEKRG